MNTVRVRLANTVLVCATSGLALAGALAGNAQCDERGFLAISDNHQADDPRDQNVSQKLRALFAQRQQGETPTVVEEQTIQQVSNEVNGSLAPEPNPQIVRQSDILRHLQELYEKDGREMPPMTLEEAPGTSGPAPAPPMQPAPNSAQQPSAHGAKSDAKRPGLLRRLFKRSPNGESSTSKREAKAPIETPAAPMRPAKSTSIQRKMRAEAPSAAPKQVAKESQSLEHASGPSESTRIQQAVTNEEPGTVRLAAPADAVESEPNRLESTSLPIEHATAKQSAPSANVAHPDANSVGTATAASTAEHSATNSSNPRKEIPESSEGVEAGEPTANPYTGLKLTDDASTSHNSASAASNEPKQPAAVPSEIPAWAVDKDKPVSETADQASKPVEPSPISESAAKPAELTPTTVHSTEHAGSSVSAKLQQIVDRTGKPGLKGYCIVALRDERELRDAQPEFQTSHEGKSYYFSTAKAKAQFIQNPSKYAPAANGADVVILAHNNQSVPGTLDHALWFRERLYLFSSAESRQSFMNNPRQYVDAAANSTSE